MCVCVCVCVLKVMTSVQFVDYSGDVRFECCVENGVNAVILWAISGHDMHGEEFLQ